jgi:hypothetical protein
MSKASKKRNEQETCTCEFHLLPRLAVLSAPGVLHHGLMRVPEREGYR